jgi:hypothetical protein
MVIFFPLVETIIILIMKLSNAIFNTKFVLNYDMLTFSYLIPFSLFYALLMMPSYLYITKVVRIDNKAIEIENTKRVMAKMKWKMKEQNQETLLFQSPISFGLFMDEITVTFNEEEVQINGPRQYIGRAISLCKYLYTPYEIEKQK